MFAQSPLSGAPLGGEGEEVLHDQITPPVGSASITGEVPGQRVGRDITPPSGTLSTQQGWGVGAWNGNYGWGDPAQNTAPVLNRDVIPAGGAKVSGSAPAVIVTGIYIAPVTGVVAIVGNVPEVRTDFFVTPAANDAVIAGSAPLIGRSSVVTPPSGAVILAGAAPEALDGQVRTPGTAGLSLVGQAPNLDSGIVPAEGVVNVAGQTPGVTEGSVITPTGGAVLVGSAPSVVVRGAPKIPGVVALNIVGHAPNIAQSRVITPPSGQLSLVGSAPVLKNPNWVNINDSQTANWVAVAA